MGGYIRYEALSGYERMERSYYNAFRLYMFDNICEPIDTHISHSIGT